MERKHTSQWKESLLNNIFGRNKMSNREDYEWRSKRQPWDFGCLGVIGLSVIVCTGAIKYGFRDGFDTFLYPKVAVVQQAGDTLYHFVCPQDDKINCDKKAEYLWAVY